MRILYITQKFFPESMAAERFLRQAVELVKLGHDVTVLTTMPSYPRGLVFPEYRGKWFRRESIQGCGVVRFRSLVAPNSGMLLRTLSYASFALGATLTGLLLRRPHLVIAAMPNPGTELAGLVIARAKRCSFLLEMVDLIPENLPFIGISENALVCRFLSSYYRGIYQLTDWVAVLCPSAAKVLESKGVNGDRIVLLPNGADDDLLDASLAEPTRRRLGCEGKFLVVYAGSFSSYYRVPNLLAGACCMARSHPQVHFAFLGDGPEWSFVAESIRSQGLRNVTLTGCVPRGELVGYLQAADLLLFSMVAEPAPPPYREILTAKLCEYLFVGRPIVAVESGSIAGETLRKIGAGTAVNAGDPAALAAAIASYVNDPELVRSSSAAGREFARERYSRSRVIKDFDNDLQKRMVGLARA